MNNGSPDTYFIGYWKRWLSKRRHTNPALGVRQRANNWWVHRWKWTASAINVSFFLILLLWSMNIISFLPQREHCLAVKELYCNKEWHSMEERNHRGVTSQSLSLTLPDCEALPSQQADPASCTAVTFVGKTRYVIFMSFSFDQRILEIRTSLESYCTVQSQSLAR